MSNQSKKVEKKVKDVKEEVKEVKEVKAEKKVEKKVKEEVKEVKAEKKVKEVKEEKKEVESKEEAKEGKKVKKVKEPKEPKEKDETKEKVPKVPVSSEQVLSDLNQLVDNLSNHSSENLKQAAKLIKQTNSKLKTLRHDVNKLLKKGTRVKKNKEHSVNSGLMKPVLISKELSEFMGVEVGSLQSRVNVTNAVCEYIKTKSLQNPENKREINADAKLAKLLNYKDSNKQKLTYFYIQQLIQSHFLKEVSDDLLNFMGVSDKLQSSTSVSASLLAYVAKKGLHVENDVVTPDEKLSKLLGKSTPFPLKNLKQLVKVHFK